MFPTLQTLLRIGMVFSVDLDYFFADHRKHRALAIVRQAERLRFPESPGRRDPSFHFESLTFPVAEPKCQAYFATFHPVADGKARPHQHAGVEVIYVLSGELGITVEATEHVLEMGDAIYFDASVSHSYRRAGRTTCSALVFSVL
jgi:mannose-6-phosphate isomerase-like protein (cupin superfamily)